MNINVNKIRIAYANEWLSVNELGKKTGLGRACLRSSIERKEYRMIRKFEGMTANDLIEILNEVPRDTKICTEWLGESFPVKQVEKCIYYDWNKGKKVREHNGILIK